MPLNGKHVLIRPLAYCREADITEYAAAREFPIMPCNLCGSQETLQRKAIKAMLHEWERKYPGRSESAFRAMTRQPDSSVEIGNGSQRLRFEQNRPLVDDCHSGAQLPHLIDDMRP